MARWLLILVFLLPAVAVGQLSEAQQRQLVAEEQAARADFKAGRFESALSRIQRVLPFAARLGNVPHGVLRRNMARCHEALGQPAEAIAAYRDYLVLTEGDSGQAAQRAKTLATLERLRTRGALAVQCGVSGTVDIVGDAPVSGACPAVFTDLPSGPVTVRVVAAGGVRTKATTQVTAGQRTELDVAVPAQAVFTGLPAEAQVWVDARPQAIDGPLDLEPGRHAIRVEAPGKAPWTAEFEAQRGVRSVVKVALQDEAGFPWVWVGVGAGAVAAGVVVWLLASEEGETREQVELQFDALSARP